ncbi:hypothetical protein ACXZ1K_16120 [Pedobacter sp. PWIIR3]
MKLHKKLTQISVVFSLLIVMYSCRQQIDLAIEPINEEFNHKYLNGGLDTNFFNTIDVTQYYQVANYGDLTDKQILTELDSFAMASFPAGKFPDIQELTLLFYKKKMFVDYNDHLYESARENENRRLEGHSDNLLAAITFKRVKENPKKMSFHSIVYNDKDHITENDTILVQSGNKPLNTKRLDTLKTYKAAPGELLYQKPGVFATFTESKKRGAGVISFQLDINDALRIYNEDGTLFGQIVLNEDLSYYTLDMPEKTVARKLIPEYDVAAFDFDAEPVGNNDQYLRIYVNGALRKVKKDGIKYVFRNWDEYLSNEKDDPEALENQ